MRLDSERQQQQSGPPSGTCTGDPGFTKGQGRDHACEQLLHSVDVGFKSAKGRNEW